MKSANLFSGLFCLLILLSFGACKNENGGNTKTKLTGEAKELKLNLKKGDVYKFKMNMAQKTKAEVMGMAMNMSNDIGSKMTYTVEATDVNGNFTLANTTDAMSMKMSGMGQNVVYDSENPTANTSGPEMQGMDKMFDAIIGKKLKTIIDKNGTVVKSEGIDEMMEAILEESGMTKEELGNMDVNDNFNQNIQQFIVAFPDKPIKVGETWKTTMESNMNNFPVRMDNTWKLIKIENGIAHINVNSEFDIDTEKFAEEMAAQSGMGEMKIEMDGTQTGTVQVEESTGMTVRSEMTQKMSMKMDMGGMTMPTDIEQTITLEKIN